MRASLAVLIALSLGLNSATAFGNKFDDLATEQISASRVAAMAYARKAVHEDLSVVLNQMFARLQGYGSALELPQTYANLLKEIEVEFTTLAADTSGRPTTSAGLEHFSVRFGETIRKRFLGSWIPAVQSNEYNFARAMMKGVIEDARSTCKEGRSLHDGNFMTPGLDLPLVVSGLRVQVTPNYIGLLTGGSPINLNYGYQSATAGSKLANRDRANLLAATTTTSNVANGFFLNAQAAALWHAAAPATNLAMTSGGALGAVSNAMVVAAPYLAGVALAAIIAVHLMAEAEASKIANQINRSRLRQMRESPDHEFVNKAYRELCEPYAAVLEKIARVLDDVDGPRRDEILTQAHAETAAIGTWQREGAEDQARQCLIDLDELHSSQGCTELLPNQTPADHQPRADAPNSFCLIDPKRQVIIPLTETCSIPVDRDKRRQLIDLSGKEHAVHIARYPFARVMELITAQVALVFEDHGSLRHRLWTENVSRIDGLQQTVQLGLERYLAVVKRAEKAAQSLRPFEIDRRWRNEFEALRRDIGDRSADVVAVIFSRRHKTELMQRLGESKLQWIELARGMPMNESMLDLGRSIDSLLETVREL